MKTKLIGLAGLATVVIGAIAFTNEQHFVLTEDTIVKGQAAPEFTATAIGNKKINFPADYKGKIVLLDFWATWCLPCHREIPYLKKANSEFAGDDFAILGVSLDKQRNRSEDRVERFTKKREMNWANIYTTGTEISQAYKVFSIPTALLIDGDTGKVLERGAVLKQDSLRKHVAKYVEAKRKEKKEKDETKEPEEKKDE